MFTHVDNIPQKQKKGNQAKQGSLFPPMGSAANERMRVCRQEPGFSRAKRREIKHNILQARMCLSV